jgi:PncC family amidohydrolase
MIMELVTKVAGASKMFCGGICSYSEDIKMKLLGVRKETLERFSVYSAQTASEMSAGALERFGCDAAAAVTGVAGPGDDGGVRAGTVFISVRDREHEISKVLRLYDEYEQLPDRQMIRRITALRTLEAVKELVMKDER